MGHHVQYDMVITGASTDLEAVLKHVGSTLLRGKEIRWIQLETLVREPSGLDFDESHRWREQHWGFLGENTCTVHGSVEAGEVRLVVTTKGGHMKPLLEALTVIHPNVFMDVAFAHDHLFCGRGSATGGMYVERYIDGHVITPETRAIIERVFQKRRTAP